MPYYTTKWLAAAWVGKRITNEALLTELWSRDWDSYSRKQCLNQVRERLERLEERSKNPHEDQKCARMWDELESIEVTLNNGGLL